VVSGRKGRKKPHFWVKKREVAGAVRGLKKGRGSAVLKSGMEGRDKPNAGLSCKKRGKRKIETEKKGPFPFCKKYRGSPHSRLEKSVRGSNRPLQKRCMPSILMLVNKGTRAQGEAHLLSVA